MRSKKNKPTGYTRRGPVTHANSIFHGNGTVSCPLSSNKYTSDEYFTIDESDFYKVYQRSFRVENSHVDTGGTHYRIATDMSKDWFDPGERPAEASRANKSSYTFLLHRLLFHWESNAVGLQVDHLLHWTDNRRGSVEFVTPEKNYSRGAALYHSGRKNRRGAA